MNAFWLEFGRYFGLFACQSLIFYIMTDCRFPRWVNRWAWMLLCAFSTLISIGLTLSDLIYIAWLYIGISAATMAVYMACYAYLSQGSWQKKLFLFSIYATVYYLVQQTSFVAAAIFSRASFGRRLHCGRRFSVS